MPNETIDLKSVKSPDTEITTEYGDDFINITSKSDVTAQLFKDKDGSHKIFISGKIVSIDEASAICEAINEIITAVRDQ